MFIFLIVPDFSVFSVMSDESERFREIGSDEDYYGRSSRSWFWSWRVSYSRSRTPSRSRSRSRSGRCSELWRHMGQSRSSEAAVEEAPLLVEQDMIKFCDVHNLDIQSSACVKCRLVSRTVGRNILSEVIKLMRAKAASSTDIYIYTSAAERYAARIDEKSPTLTFSKSDLTN